MKELPKPTEHELDLLRILWEREGGTIAEVHESFRGKIAYPTVQIRLNRLVDKGYATKSEERPARYTAAISRNQASMGHLQSLAERIGGGSVVPLVAQLVNSKVSKEELAEIRQLLDQAEGRKRTDRGG